MAEAGRQALVDLSGIDPASLRLPEGSVLERALARALREREEGGWTYSSHMDDSVIGDPPGAGTPPRQGEAA